MTTKARVERWQKTPKYSTKKVSFCFRCKRNRGYLREFGVCRICFRELAHKGQIPGLKKASW
ncbi:MAG: type Z 30S ribosomal protein S14 [Patescibacteria group bacterium]